MPYSLIETHNRMTIAECQWAAAKIIQFTKFTSCIGILAKLPMTDEVIGIHLALVDTQKNIFATADVSKVTKVLKDMKYDSNTVLIIGQIPYWKESAKDAYDRLVNALKPKKTYTLTDGTYGAKIDNKGTIELTNK